MSGTRILDIAILDPDEITGRVLHDALKEFKARRTVEGVGIRLTPRVKSIKEAIAVFKRGSANTLIMDIYLLGAREGVEFYQFIRDNYPLVPVCRYATQSDLDKQPGVLEDWMDREGFSWLDRLGHVYKIQKNLDSDDLAKAIERELIHFRDWIESHEQNPTAPSDKTIPVIRLKSELAGQNTAQSKTNSSKLATSNVPEITQQQTELGDKPYLVAQNGPFEPATAGMVSQLRERKDEFEVWVDKEKAQYFVDHNPIKLQKQVRLLLRYLLAEKGQGEIPDIDIARHVLDYDTIIDVPLRQLYKKLRDNLGQKISKQTIVRIRGEDHRVFNRTFTYCWIERRR